MYKSKLTIGLIILLLSGYSGMSQDRETTFQKCNTTLQHLEQEMSGVKLDQSRNTVDISGLSTGI